MSDTYELSQNSRTGNHHLIAPEKPARPVSRNGEMKYGVVSLCGAHVEEPFRDFKGFDTYRDIEFCDMCRQVYIQREEDGAWFNA